MNTDCLLILRPTDNRDPKIDLTRAEATVREYESRFSRFLRTSDLAYLNDHRCGHVQISSQLAALLGRGLEYARLTGGVFDPIVLADMQAIGYDRTFDEVAHATQAMPASTTRRFRWPDVHVDIDRHLVSRPYGAFIDLGGLAKGAAGDAAARLSGHLGALVDLGGDIRTAGQPDDAAGWCVGLDDGNAETLDTIRLVDGAIATSSTTKRRWLNNGANVHHVIDPRTGRPCGSRVR